jgi:hypothetical protein
MTPSRGMVQAGSTPAATVQAGDIQFCGVPGLLAENVPGIHL